MKAPEKIYINDFGSEFSYDWHTEHCCESDIEYICSDAFLIKARKWFEKQNEWHDINGIKHCDMESFEDFKNYMEL